ISRQHQKQIAVVLPHIPQGEAVVAAARRQVVVEGGPQQGVGLAQGSQGRGGGRVDLVQLADQTAVRRQGFGCQGEALFHLFQPLHRGLYPAVASEVAEGGIPQAVGLVENVDGLLRRGQYRAPAEGQVGHHQIVIGDDAVDVIQLPPGAKKGALLELAAAVVGALAAIDGQCPPQVVGDGGGPAVAVAVPAALRQGRLQLAEKLATGGVATKGHFVLEQKLPGIPGRGGVDTEFETDVAQVAAATLGEGEGVVPAGGGQQFRDVLVDQLGLQGDG